MGRCVVPGCVNSPRNSSKSRIFHSFPNEPVRRREWEVFVGKGFVALKSSTICSDHFTKESYSLKSRLLNLDLKQRSLAKDAVPVLLCAGAKPPESSSRSKRKEKRARITLVADIMESHDQDAMALMEIENQEKFISKETQTL